ncbi:uncharacterized protein KNAG_0C04210 [Huiozyma naganishii CBS 8797]|uniref:Uncharacterized protein n=1 Tax=Huiozyma naganishii (strain ATCC MYA-139 / BCRC 22969 / CBS 8797 / KCTC 17520 / NBRC 10181 / NCYC 3082 / Yp74L-3) TaxID=1071383 RepID=J7RJ38_HUIN7|nr:hypothetical protein KNAG_0C04210 [Kazachstania naganishii CBS 8797]CCK69523.1 hypothetical protein KNAG_0C04210 [Kazachstania naganishii CBS 8797]
MSSPPVSRDTSSTTSINYISEVTDINRQPPEIDPSDIGVSRPMSRCSIQPTTVIVTTKTGAETGAEGKRPYRKSAGQCSFGLMDDASEQSSTVTLNTKCQRRYEPHEGAVHPSARCVVTSEDVVSYGYANSGQSTPASFPDLPNLPPMTLKEKMKLLNIDRNQLGSSIAGGLNSSSLYSLGEQQLLESNGSSNSFLLRNHYQACWGKLRNTNTAYQDEEEEEGGVEALGEHNKDSNSHYLDLLIGHHQRGNDLDSMVSTVDDDMSYINSLKYVPLNGTPL